MIINEKQYRISKKLVKEINSQIEKTEKEMSDNPVRTQVVLATLINSKTEVENNIKYYESLKENRKSILKERAISELPSLITEYKIMCKLTQKELAEILELKEQQLQRYEANGFKSVTFKNLLRFFDLIGLEITIKDTRVTRTYRAYVKKKPKS